MSSSKSLLDNRSFNKLVVNRLDAQKICSDNISSLTPSYLFSGVFNGNFSRNSTGGTLTFTKSDVDSIIQFSDRPFRQTNNITFEQFVSLFSGSNIGSNTFAEDPPNGVLVHEEEQRTYIIRLASKNLDSAIFSLELISGEKHNESDIKGRMSFFVDSKSNTAARTADEIDALRSEATVIGPAAVAAINKKAKAERAEARGTTFALSALLSKALENQLKD